MKKAISLLLALVMLCMAFPTSVFALNEYIVYDGVAGCRLNDIALTQEDNPWLLYDIDFNSSDNGRVFTTADDHPNLIGCKAVLDLSFEGALLTFNGKAFNDGDSVTLKEINELVVYTADKATKAEYSIVITEKTNGLPVVLIDTVNDVLPENMTKLDYDDAYISVLGGDIYGGDDIYAAVAGIKLRGNSTMGYDKKPFRIKFDKKQNVLGLGKAKSWVLLADYLDPSALRNQVAFNLADRINNFTADKTGGQDVFSPRMKLVEVYFDGEFMGLYEMGDHMQANELRVKVNELGDEEDDDGNNLDLPGADIGYFIEVEVKSRVLQEGADGYADWSAYSYITDVGSLQNSNGGYAQVINQKDKDQYLINESDMGKTALYFQFKLPEKPTDQQKGYITDYMQQVNDLIVDENASNDEQIWELVDMDSVINWYLVNELFKNADSQMQSSVYFYKGGTTDMDGEPNSDTKLYMAPVWDFDLGAGGVSYGGMNNPTEWRTRNDEYCGWFRELFEMDSFRNAVEERWAELREEGILGQMFSDIDSIGAFAKDAAEDNFELWHENYLSEIDGTWMTVPGVSETGDWTAQLTYLSRWLYTRVLWMDGKFGYNGASNTANATTEVKKITELFKSETLTATKAGANTFELDIGYNLSLSELALNMSAAADCPYDIQFQIKATAKPTYNSFSFTHKANLAGDWKDGTTIKEAVNGYVTNPLSFTDLVCTLNGAIAWSLAETNKSATGITDSWSTVRENISNYVSTVCLEKVIVKLNANKAGDAITFSVSTFDQSFSTPSSVTSTKSVTTIGGAPIIAGEPKVGNTLTLTDLGITPFGASVRYQWYVDDVPVQGETGKTYKVQPADFGKDVVVKAFGLFAYTGNVESEPVTITGDGTTPATPNAPTLQGKTTDSITVNTVNGQMYSIDNGETWQTSGEFTDLKAGNVYTVRTYVPASSASPASDVSEALVVTTDVLGGVKGDVNASGKLDTSDAVLVLEHALEFVTIKNDAVLALADISGDGDITTSDARHILYYIVNTAD